MQTKLFLLIIGISIYVLPLFSQTSYQDLRNKIDTVKIDTSTFGIMYGTQLDEIFMDMKQINEALSQKSDSLTMVIANMHDFSLKNISKSKLYMYVAIGSTFLFVLFALLWITFMIKASKNKKLYQKANLEIGKGKAEIEKLNSYINSEKEQYQHSKEMLEKELKQIQQLLQQKENELTQNKNNLEQSIEQFKQENKHLNEELSQWVAKNEETADLINELNERLRVKNEQILNLENELKKLSQTSNTYLIQLDELKKNNEVLQMQIAEANATKEKVNEELKKFVQELQTMLPLPKS